MEDAEIVGLYLARDERAVRATQEKYGGLLRSIAGRVLASAEDAEECVNECYLRLWSAIPPARPERLGAFAVKAVRNVALDHHRKNAAKRRVPNERQVSLSELEECVCAQGGADESANADEGELREHIAVYLAGISPEARNVFICRYFAYMPVKELAAAFAMSESKAKSMLHRTRAGLRSYLIEKGYHHEG